MVIATSQKLLEQVGIKKTDRYDWDSVERSGEMSNFSVEELRAFEGTV